MKRYAMLILCAGAACAPHYESGKTECSDNRECPSGYSCSDDGTTAKRRCFDNQTLGCPDTSVFYCSQSKTCWSKPGACSTVTNCGTASAPKYFICGGAGYHPDCNGTNCVPNGDGGPIGGTGGGTVQPGTGGGIASGGVAGTSGVRDAGAGGTGGARDAGATGGMAGTGALRDAGLGGGVVVGGATGRGGATGAAGASGGTTLCSGTQPAACASQTIAGMCKSENGCSWNSSTSTCSGTPAPCSSYSSATWCVYNACNWSGSYTCRPTSPTTACTGSLSPGADACNTCIVNSCCGQMTACNAEAGCLSSMSGPAWEAYIDCVVNCCHASC